MKKILIGLIYITGSFTISAQSKAERAPLNPEFINYIEYSKTNVEKKSAEEYSKGYVPSPMLIHFNKTGIQNESRKSMQSFPERYNLRDSGWVTPVRNQGPVGACWSFSTMGAIESRWLKLGYGDTATLNLSEQNMATCHGFQAGINDGGSDYIAAAYLSRLSGPVTEASDPYKPVISSVCNTAGLVHPAYSPQTIWLPKDINIIKKAIIDYGAVTASIYMGTYTNYLNSVDKTYFYNGTAPVDHGVLVIGWDDNMVVTGNMYKPLHKGAWIIKNSWGPFFGAKGYFYVSYEDSRVLSSCSYYPERIELSEIDTMLMYDWLGATSSYGFGQETATGIARFEATQQMFINKIGTFVNASGSVIDVEVYNEFIGDSILNGLVATSTGNFCKFPGYYTFDIPALVSGTYYVKVKYNTPGYHYPIPVEAEIVYQGKPYALPVIEPAGRFWISKDEKEWKPLGDTIKDYEADLSIRVYADRNTELNAFFTSNKTISCIGGDVIYTDASNGIVGQYEWNFGAGASPATAISVTPDQQTVSYSTPGLKDISLTITGPGGVTTLVKKSYIEVVEALDIFLPYSKVLLVNGKTFPIVAHGADTYSWSPATGLNTTTGSTVIASPADTTTYTVTGVMGTCTGSASITLNVVQNPPNDDVCNAIEVIQGTQNYSNIYATVEDGEPAPPENDTSCNAPLTWCVEGGLQNSVWFWFIAPDGGKVTFMTDGMDTQLALYKAETCDSILNKGYKLIAANDDYYGEAKFFAGALDTIRVIPGQKYFLQIDGSAGGVEGHFSLTYYVTPIAVKEIASSAELSLYPNPNNGTFRFAYTSGKSENLRIRVLNSKGQIFYKSNIKNPTTSFEQEIGLSKLSPGIYIFELTSNDKVLHKNFVVQ
jgi:C1A family cysteine protease/PKD repeat protein